MATIEFRGTAPVPKGTDVEMSVDDVNRPTEAFWIWDREHDIRYTLGQRAEQVGAKAGSVRATVQKVVVRASGGSELTVDSIRPI